MEQLSLTKVQNKLDKFLLRLEALEMALVNKFITPEEHDSRKIEYLEKTVIPFCQKNNIDYQDEFEQYLL